MNAESDKITFFRVSGDSMLPWYKDGDIVWGRPFDGTLERGRSYGFFYSGKKLLHRFVRIRGGDAVFAGDFSARFERVPVGNVFFTVEEPEGKLYINLITAANALFYLFRRCPLAGRMKMALLKRAFPCLRRKSHGNKRTL
jgi:signal peptidase I